MSGSLLVLWDVDGTLIDNGGVGKRTHAGAFLLLTGMPATERVITDGMTDLAIMRSMVERHGLEFTAELATKTPTAMAQALVPLAAELPRRGRSLPGAHEAIKAVARIPGTVQSLLTGNVAENAHAKLAAFGLGPELDFSVGGYGSDSELRYDLVAVACQRAETKYGRGFVPVLIGDTPRDVEAAKRGGARIIAVATGLFTEEQLRAEGADLTLPDLCDIDQLLSALKQVT